MSARACWRGDAAAASNAPGAGAGAAIVVRGCAMVVGRGWPGERARRQRADAVALLAVAVSRSARCRQRQLRGGQHPTRLPATATPRRSAGPRALAAAVGLDAAGRACRRQAMSSVSAVSGGLLGEAPARPRQSRPRQSQPAQPQPLTPRPAILPHPSPRGKSRPRAVPRAPCPVPRAHPSLAHSLPLTLTRPLFTVASQPPPSSPLPPPPTAAAEMHQLLSPCAVTVCCRLLLQNAATARCSL